MLLLQIVAVVRGNWDIHRYHGSGSLHKVKLKYSFSRRKFNVLLTKEGTCSLVPGPFRLHANILARLFFTIRKAERSGQFGNVMVMSHGHGLNMHGLLRYTPLTAHTWYAVLALLRLS